MKSGLRTQEKRNNEHHKDEADKGGTGVQKQITTDWTWK